MTPFSWSTYKSPQQVAEEKEACLLRLTEASLQQPVPSDGPPQHLIAIIMIIVVGVLSML